MTSAIVEPDGGTIGALLERVTDAVVVLDHQRRYVYMNARAEVLLRQPRTALIGRTIGEAFPDSVTSPFLAHYERVMATGEAVTFEGFSASLGAWLKGRVQPVPAGVAILFRNATARRQAEAALHLQARLLDQTGVAIIATNPAGMVTHWNAHASTLYGWSREEVLGRDISTLTVGPEDHATGRVIMARLRAGESWSGEFTVRRRDGTTFPAHVTDAPVYDAEGQMAAIVGVSYDITARKAGEAALRAHEAMLVEAQRLAHLGSWDYDLTTGALAWSDETYRILGLGPGDHPPTLAVFLAAVHPDDRARVEGVVHDSLRGGEYDLAYRIVRPGGTVRTVHARGEVIVGADGRRDRLVGAVLDVTEREALAAERAAQEQRLQALVGQLLTAQEEERRRVAYDVHDGLAQLVAGAYQCLQVYAHRHGSTAPGAAANLDRALGLLRRATSEARQIINALRPTTLDDFGLSAAVRELVEGLRAAGWGVAYTASLGQARLPATVEVALFRVAQEALTNVRKHAGSGRVMVSLDWVAEGRVRLAVEDFGRGFDPVAVVCDGGPGERLGLPGMRERAALLGGCLTIDSRLAVGTRVIAEVPLLQALE